MKAVYELTAAHVEQLHRLYQCEWWTAGRTLDDTRQAVEGSQLCVGLLDGDAVLQGFARVLTDYVFKALILDVIVAAPYRGAGLGERLMVLIEQHQRLARVKHLELYCLPELQGFYRRAGFSGDVGGIQLMRYINT